MAADLRERDRRDRTRAASPLVAAEDAVVIDSTQLSEDEVVERIEEAGGAATGGERHEATSLMARCFGGACNN